MPTTAPRRPDALDRDLRPAAGRAAEIDDPAAGRQQMKALVELDQLEGGARAIAEPLRLGDIGIVQLPRQPFGRGRFPPARALDAHGKGGCQPVLPRAMRLAENPLPGEMA